jgi:hypothetical protein
VKRSKKKRTARTSKSGTRTRFRGTIEWNGDPGKIERALIRERGRPIPYEHDIAISCTYENRKRYEIVLDRHEGDFYVGSYSASLGDEKWTGRVNGILQRFGRKVQIAGKWDEGGEVYSWGAELTPIPSSRRLRPRRKG